MELGKNKRKNLDIAIDIANTNGDRANNLSTDIINTNGVDNLYNKTKK